MESGIVIPKEAKMKYVERRKKDVESLRQALTQKDFSEFKKIGHQIKGNSSTFGFMDLEIIAKALELVGMSEDFAQATSVVDQFERWVNRAAVEVAQ